MKKFPSAFIIIIGAVVFAWVLTFIIPQGSYERNLNPETGITQVVNDSYHQLKGDKLSFFDLILAIPRGIVGRADLIVLILLLGGCFYVIEKTGTMSQGLNKLVHLLNGKESLALVIISAIFTIAGAGIGLQEESIAMTPMLLIFGRSLGYNTFTVICMSYGSSVIGSSFSPSNPFGVIIAQKEANLPLMSGTNFRLVFLLIAFIVWVIYLMYYAKKNKIDKTKVSDNYQPISLRSSIILSLLGITFLIVTYGLVMLEWGFNEMSACFFTLGIAAGLIGKLGINGTGDAYIAGFKDMILAAMILGLANSLSIILQEGLIIDTIVYGLFGPLKYLSPAVSAVLMMVSQAVLHYPIPSYSGQAILTMPILIPLSDLIGLSRQVCVLAYQYGAILGDLFIPTNGALMAILAISGVSFNKWMKFILKPALIMLFVGALGIIVGVIIGL